MELLITSASGNVETGMASTKRKIFNQKEQLPPCFHLKEKPSSKRIGFKYGQQFPPKTKALWEKLKGIAYTKMNGFQ